MSALTFAIEQWTLSADTADIFGNTLVRIPFDTRSTAFDDLGNTVDANGELTLHADVLSAYTLFRSSLYFVPLNFGTRNWFTVEIQDNAGSSTLFRDNPGQFVYGPVVSSVTPWLPLSEVDTSIAAWVAGIDTLFGADDNFWGGTRWQLEFR